MDLTSASLDGHWLLLTQWLMLPLLAISVWRAPWRYLRRGVLPHVFMGSVLAVSLIWHLRANPGDGPALHLVGATYMTLMFGWPLATLGMALALVVGALTHLGDWGALPLNWLLLGYLPVSVSYGWVRLVERWLPVHFFVYVYVAAFFGAVLSVGSVGLASGGLLAVGQVFDSSYALREYLWYFLLLLFPEAFITGTLITLFVAFRPHWVISFDDRRYLHGR
jgi:uncharacterized membrane protein